MQNLSMLLRQSGALLRGMKGFRISKCEVCGSELCRAEAAKELAKILQPENEAHCSCVSVWLCADP